MKFMVLVHPANLDEYESGKMPAEESLTMMNKFNEELVDAGVMQVGEGLHPSSDSVRVRFSEGGRSDVKEGPFKITEDFVAGYWIWNVKSRDEALEWARRAPMAPGDVLELRQVYEPADFGPEIEKQERALLEKIEQQRVRH